MRLENFIVTNKYKDGQGQIIDSVVNPLRIDNRQLCSPTDNQGTTSSCAGYSCAQLLESVYWKFTGKPIQLDARQIYKKAKTIDGNPKSNGTTLEAAMSSALQLCNFDSEKWSVEKFFKMKDDIPKTIDTVKFLIHKYDFLLGGFHISSGWEKVDKFSCCVKKTKKDLGGHCVLLCGYDKTGVYIQNSWGKDWGAKGFAIVDWERFAEEFVYCAWVSLKKP
jgi:hypothetical protein